MQDCELDDGLVDGLSVLGISEAIMVSTALDLPVSPLARSEIILHKASNTNFGIYSGEVICVNSK